VLSPTVTLIPFIPRARTAASDFLQCPSVTNTSEFITCFPETIPIKKTKKPFQRWGKDEQTQIEKLFTAAL
jgi:hypothetical protein